MIFDKDNYQEFDKELWDAIHAEEDRQEHNIELIASENVVSKAVMKAQGSVLTLFIANFKINCTIFCQIMTSLLQNSSINCQTIIISKQS